MASLFGHGLLGFTLSQTLVRRKPPRAFWVGMILLTFLPDADNGLRIFGLLHDPCFGHRGFTHSILFAVVVALLYVAFFLRRLPWPSKVVSCALLFLAAVSHPVLDAFTNGGRGVAFFWPMTCERYFFPFRPIEVSPLSVSKFFSEHGWQILQSEALWIGVPCGVALLASHMIGKGR